MQSRSKVDILMSYSVLGALFFFFFFFLMMISLQMFILELFLKVYSMISLGNESTLTYYFQPRVMQSRCKVADLMSYPILGILFFES